MTPILDYNCYLSGMSKSIQDKLYFLDRVDPSINTIVDYGCADGALLKSVKQIKQGWSLVGYDIDDEMIHRARDSEKGIFFTTIYSECLENINPASSILNLSSVIHEVYFIR